MWKANLEKLASGETPGMEVPRGGYQGAYRGREVPLGIQLFQLMDIAREDSEKRLQWTMKGFGFFDAPAATICNHR